MTTIADTIKKAMSTHWVDTPYAHGPVEAMAWHLAQHFTLVCGKGLMTDFLDMKDITEERIEAFKDIKRRHGVSNATINKYLSCLSVLFDVAQVPKPTIKRLPEKRVEKWWMPPDQLEDLLKYLRSCEAGGNKHFADFLEVLAKQGLRVKEALGLKVRHMSQDLRHLRVPGTKTGGAEATIPIFGGCKEVFERLRDAASSRDILKDDLFVLDYEEAQMRWNKERIRLGLADVPTATLKALRRTFAAYATQAGMPTATLQKVMRHESITTTQGYLRLTGDPALEEARKYMVKGELPLVVAPTGNVQFEGLLASSIKAYTETGATPEEVAEFTKALLKG